MNVFTTLSQRPKRLKHFLEILLVIPLRPNDVFILSLLRYRNVVTTFMERCDPTLEERLFVDTFLRCLNVSNERFHNVITTSQTFKKLLLVIPLRPNDVFITYLLRCWNVVTTFHFRF